MSAEVCQDFNDFIIEIHPKRNKKSTILLLDWLHSHQNEVSSMIVKASEEEEDIHAKLVEYYVDQKGGLKDSFKYNRKESPFKSIASTLKNNNTIDSVLQEFYNETVVVENIPEDVLSKIIFEGGFMNEKQQNAI